MSDENRVKYKEKGKAE